MSKSSPRLDIRPGDPIDSDQVDDRAPEPIDPADRAAVEAGLADMRAGRLATPAEIETAYARFGRGSR